MLHTTNLPTYLNLANGQQIINAVAGYLSKNSILPVKLLGGCQCQEKLTPICVRGIPIGASQQSTVAELKPGVELVFEVFAVNRLAPCKLTRGSAWKLGSMLEPL